MLRRRIIPCLDVSGGRVVKGVEFVNLRDCGEPVDAALRYAEQGADELCWLNITAGDEAWDELLTQVADAGTRIDVPLTVGGGVSDEPHVRDLLGAGADKVSINSAALDRPDLVAECAERHGSQCIVVAIDARRTPDGTWEAVASGVRRATGVPLGRRRPGHQLARRHTGRQRSDPGRGRRRDPGSGAGHAETGQPLIRPLQSAGTR